MLVLTQKVVTETYAEDGGLLGPGPSSRRKYVQSFPATLTVEIPGSLHGLGTADLLFQVYSAETPAQGLPVLVTVDPQTCDVVIVFTQPQAGRVILFA